jgi:hypothetical protein
MIKGEEILVSDLFKLLKSFGGVLDTTLCDKVCQ